MKEERLHLSSSSDEVGQGLKSVIDDVKHLRIYKLHEDVLDERLQRTTAPARAKIGKLLSWLPDDTTLERLARLGAPGMNWIRDSSEAILALVGPDDFDVFTRLVGAISPQRPVKQNLLDALETLRQWKLYQKSGGVSTADFASQLYESHPRLRRGWKVRTNIEHALNGRRLGRKSFKSESFSENLRGIFNSVTLDRWMARMLGLKPEALGDAMLYSAATARIRMVGKSLGWGPDQVQSAIWTAAKSLDEQISLKTSLEQALKNVRDSGDLPDSFASLLAADPEVASISLVSPRFASHPLLRSRRVRNLEISRIAEELLKISHWRDKLRNKSGE